jgi:5-formyltetrahydrofolate cyclo-ligase
MGQAHTPHADLTQAKRRMRQEMRARRQSLSPGQQQRAAQRLAKQLIRLPAFLRSRHVALYLPNDGEIDPRPLTQLAWRMGKRCYLPVLHPMKGRQLAFVRFRPDTRLRPNRFGIPEPDFRRASGLAPQYLDLVLLPLVAFDHRGGRLGMGGGFYDTTFAFKRRHRGPHCKPQLVGLAHGCQEADEVVRENWDVPLSAVITDEGIISTLSH